MDLENKAIERIKAASQMCEHTYKKPLICTYSGGKDSAVMLELFRRSGINFEVSNSHTTVDPPENVRHIRNVFRKLELEGIKCTIDYHDTPAGRITMWSLIPSKLMPPTRIVRYCCSELKESSNHGRMVATGVRWAESTSRKDRDAFEVLGKTKKEAIHYSDEKMLLTDQDDRLEFENCMMKHEVVVNPIIDWTDEDIWDYYRNECRESNPIYEMGFTRIGCIGCPLSRRKNRLKEFAIWPKYKECYLRAFDKMLRERAIRHKEYPGWECPQDVFDWWIEDDNVKGQMSLDEFMDME